MIASASAAEEIGANLRDGGVALLENVRFHPEEEKNDRAFAQALAKLGDVYVNDAFGSAHRAHASTEGVREACAGRGRRFLMQKELRYLAQELEKPARPFVVVLGGAKVSDKITVIDRLLEKADMILIGGAMAYTFELAKGRSVGKSLSEPDKVETARAALNKAEKLGVKFLLPVDSYIVEQIDFEKRTVSPGKFTPPNEPHSGRLDGRRYRAGNDQAASATRSRRRARSSGTDRWACSKSKNARKALSPSRKRSRQIQTPSASSAAATR